MKLTSVRLLGAALALAMMFPAQAVARDRTVFTVYFEWDSSVLNASAFEVVKVAAPKAKACEYNGLRIVGHADTSRTEEESSALGMARARAVRDALVKLGMADSAISVATHGELDLARPTRDGVREPLNRRAEIIVVCD